eukprot:365515-Chlamydomonas_euryale.AAC.2
MHAVVPREDGRELQELCRVAGVGKGQGEEGGEGGKNCGSCPRASISLEADIGRREGRGMRVGMNCGGCPLAPVSLVARQVPLPSPARSPTKSPVARCCLIQHRGSGGRLRRHHGRKPRCDQCEPKAALEAPLARVPSKPAKGVSCKWRRTGRNPPLPGSRPGAAGVCGNHSGNLKCQEVPWPADMGHRFQTKAAAGMSRKWRMAGQNPPLPSSRPRAQQPPVFAATTAQAPAKTKPFTPAQEQAGSCADAQPGLPRHQVGYDQGNHEPTLQRIPAHLLGSQLEAVQPQLPRHQVGHVLLRLLGALALTRGHGVDLQGHGVWMCEGLNAQVESDIGRAGNRPGA